MKRIKRDVQERLENLIREFGTHKAKADKLKTQCDAENAEIKQIMTEQQIDEWESGDYIAKFTITKRESMNDDMLLDIAKKHKKEFKNIIKTREYVDMDELEKAIYHDAIPKAILLELDKAREVKEVPTLRVSKKKKEKKS